MDFLEELLRRPVLADGAMATELWARGFGRDRCLEELSVSGPAAVSAVHTAYLEAGARFIKTNTFGANAVRLERFGLERHVAEFNWTSTQLARDSAKPFQAQVVGSVGPLGIDAAEVERRGLDREELFSEQIGALLDGGARIILLETFTDLEELAIALYVKQSLHHCAAIACVACDESARLSDGTELLAAFERLREAGADVVGVNCFAASEPLLEVMRQAADEFTLAALPSAGIPQEHEGALVYPVSPGAFAHNIAALAGAGVRFLGGCCGVGPLHIAHAAEAVEAFFQSAAAVENETL